MSKLNELITELCPDGVEHRRLGEMCEIKTGKGITRKDGSPNGEFPIISGGKEPMGYFHQHNRDANTVTISRVGANAGFINFIEQKFYLNDKCFSVIPANRFQEKLDCKFLYEVLKSLEKAITDMQSQGGVPTINTQKVSSIKVPVPPLPVQQEIVRILDTFMELTAELLEKLNVELQSRKTQYAEYCHRLFSDSECVRKTTLGEIVDVCMCKRIKKEQTSSVGDVPFYQNGTLGGIAKLFITKELFEEFSKKYKYPLPGEVMLSTVGTVGKAIQFDGNPAYFQDSNIVWLRRKTNEVTNEFLYWYCLSMPWKLPERATLKHLHNYMITGTEIAIPSLERQAYIIQKFQQLTSSFEQVFETIKKEIEARRKQYEYCRDKLLTFKEASA